MTAVLYASLAVLIVVPAWFILHDVYDDGIVGRAALGGVILAAAVLLMQAVDAAPTPPAAAVLLIASFAAFLVWHLFRFHRRVLRARSDERREKRDAMMSRSRA